MYDESLQQFPVDALINLALTEQEEEAWPAIGELHRRGSREVLLHAARLARSSCPQERELAAQVLAQLGADQATWLRERVHLLSGMLQVEESPRVLEAALIGLAHADGLAAVEAALPFAHHPSARVRYAVVWALKGHDDEPSLTQLIVLTRDPDAQVRDWATFGLGTISQADTPALGQALADRLNDTDFDTRSEAMVGLAERRDPRAAPAVLAHLESGEVGRLGVEAAQLLGDPSLRSALESLRDWWDVDEILLEAAIRACSKN